MGTSGQSGSGSATASNIFSKKYIKLVGAILGVLASCFLFRLISTVDEPNPQAIQSDATPTLDAPISSYELSTQQAQGSAPVEGLDPMIFEHILLNFKGLVIWLDSRSSSLKDISEIHKAAVSTSLHCAYRIEAPWSVLFANVEIDSLRAHLEYENFETIIQSNVQRVINQGRSWIPKSLEFHRESRDARALASAVSAYRRDVIDIRLHLAKPLEHLSKSHRHLAQTLLDTKALEQALSEKKKENWREWLGQVELILRKCPQLTNDVEKGLFYLRSMDKGLKEVEEADAQNPAEIDVLYRQLYRLILALDDAKSKKGSR